MHRAHRPVNRPDSRSHLSRARPEIAEVYAVLGGLGPGSTSRPTPTTRPWASRTGLPLSPSASNGSTRRKGPSRTAPTIRPALTVVSGCASGCPTTKIAVPAVAAADDSSSTVRPGGGSTASRRAKSSADVELSATNRAEHRTIAEPAGRNTKRSSIGRPTSSNTTWALVTRRPSWPTIPALPPWRRASVRRATTRATPFRASSTGAGN